MVYLLSVVHRPTHEKPRVFTTKRLPKRANSYKFEQEAAGYNICLQTPKTRDTTRRWNAFHYSRTAQEAAGYNICLQTPKTRDITRRWNAFHYSRTSRVIFAQLLDPLEADLDPLAGDRHLKGPILLRENNTVKAERRVTPIIFKSVLQLGMSLDDEMEVSGDVKTSSVAKNLDDLVQNEM